MPINHLPKRFQPRATLVRDYLLSDASAFLILTYISVGHALAYSGEFLVRDYVLVHPAESLVNPPFWGIIWAMVALLSLAGAVKRTSLVAVLAIGAGSMMLAMWSLSAITGHFAGTYDRGILGFSIYTGLLHFLWWSIWRGSRAVVSIRAEGKETI